LTLGLATDARLWPDQGDLVGGKPVLFRKATLKRTDVPMLTRNFDSSEVDSV